MGHERKNDNAKSTRRETRILAPATPVAKYVSKGHTHAEAAQGLDAVRNAKEKEAQAEIERQMAIARKIMRDDHEVFRTLASR